MKPKIRAAWVAALRSGEYRQARGALRTTDNRMCCLGVLCNLHAQAHPGIAAKEQDRRTYLDNSANLPEQVVHWAGLLYDIGDEVSINGRTRSLAGHNDSGRTFAQIADAIEGQL